MQKKILYVILLLAMTMLSCSKIAEITANLMFTDEEEIKIGTNFSQQIENEPGFTLYTKNLAFVEYVDSLGQSIVKTQHRTIPYYFKVVDDDNVVNAFALPGGYIYVYTGLVKKMKSEDELAGVLAHEIGHISQRHGVKNLVKSNFYGTIADLLLGDGKSKKWAEMLLAFKDLKNSRDMELEADSCSVTYSAQSNNNPLGMKTFLRTLQEMGGDKIPEFISSHPKPENRIKYVQEVIDRNHPGATSEAVNPINDLKIKP